ncbi:VWA containing CoxE family protein [Catenulispora acidiphila DSM 44928]|uniref:VWA containing CoxE family protein n=1 Tax=Catenulispora acidiphila (strain DSM 44928 / JCM 14897 / NBRC 102108 / NRRL B-24433 / ID139908) TaxID=479433 RepID=C7QG94_CATAD|nr:VWA domain-containing protein [Catenulispora acidiphila]ACU72939.1 VWA containing CoxE family protein [Catenulispora acidiphila DSM 44928]
MSSLAAHLHRTPTTPDDSDLEMAAWDTDGGAMSTGPQHPTAPDPTDTELAWLAVSAQLSEQAAEIAGRDDLVVSVQPRTRSGAKGLFATREAAIELESGLFTGIDPATIDASDPADRERYAAAWGVFCHEAGGHAAHSVWDVPHGAEQAATQVAIMLEESRCEAALVARRPGDAKWLRASASTLILPNIDPAPGEATSWAAAGAAGLILARADAGILEPEDVATLEAHVAEILGEEVLEDLRAIWTAARECDDEDAETMIDLGREWCDLVGVDSDAPAPGLGEPGPDGIPGPLAEAVGAVMAAVSARIAADGELEAEIIALASAAAAERASEAAASASAERVSGRIFGPASGPGGRRRTRTPVSGTRAPYPAEVAAAAQLARALKTAAYRERTETVTHSATPPGRLSMRGALAHDAQKAAGAIPTATPWVHTSRRHQPSPPLRVGIAVDISGSMYDAAAPVASAAWITARAIAVTNPDCKTATVAFGNAVTPITRPGTNPTAVTEFRAEDMAEKVCTAIDALDGGLGLTRPGAARLLVIVSDGHFVWEERAGAQARVDRLIASGCAVLWIALADGYAPAPLNGCHVLSLADPASAGAEIGKAAAKALSATR